ncbi:3D-(3,5/4)-trihydroxycyclohexane-1,2-dione acylhydrolase (decyclizing) [Rectinema subterraneum]|jgi:3D-(3,5/4)-trihydroxycyclohexane-1,2-dione acylhydrolase (decyclizing)|uniref:3D-(3,5/4)-trihydroxycyclohexane-1,2-dione acylhydrolase (decyclizing) n=1 Tax=Rectinema subterraneum TaxID=2653714 RepID=UPI00131D5C1D|nr:3D-(3,5/4)-trihydroxycyclohexane-1,2-dione acylhydrolase (decyclizing) [Rectinema subterraneum]
METIRMTVGQAIVRFLDNQYIEFDGKVEKFVGGVIGIFGHGVVVGLGEALAAPGHNLPFIQAKNEQGAGHVAIGYAKQNNRRKIMAVTSSIGPGALNMVTAAGTATVNHIPVLFLPGDVFADRQPDPVLQQLEVPHDATISANDAFRPVSRYFDRITRPEQIMTALIHAMSVLTDPAQGGAVTIALPQDVQGVAYDYPVELFDQRIHHIERRPPTSTQVARIVSLIKSAEKPYVICGGGVRYSEAGRALADFCKKFDIPLGETQAGKGSVPWDHPCNLSGIGVTGSLAANRLAKEADLIIGVGTRFGDFTTCSKWLFQNPKARFVSINVAPFDANKMNAEPIIADAKLTLLAMSRALGAADYKARWGDKIARAREEWAREVDSLYTQEDPMGLSQIRVIGELNDVLLPKNAIVVSGSGSIPSDMQRTWRTRVPGTYHMEYGFSCMGYEIAASLGAKLAMPERECVAIVGDGAYTMLHTELLTAVQEGRKIIVVVCDNSGFQCIDNLQHSQGIAHFGNEWRKRDPKTGLLAGEQVQVDFAKNAESWGALGLRARTVEEFRKAVRRALRAKGPVVIHARVSPKSMTHGYESWWRVGTAEVSDNPEVVRAAEEMKAELAKARKF